MLPSGSVRAIASNAAPQAAWATQVGLQLADDPEDRVFDAQQDWQRRVHSVEHDGDLTNIPDKNIDRLAE
jgi:hypothetical protein